MLRSVKDLINYPVLSADEKKVGKVKDVLFGDQHWRMRYLDVETRVGFHLNLRYLSESDPDEERPTRHLLEPGDVSAPSMGIDRRSFHTELDQEALRARPGFDQRLPVEEQYDREFRKFFRHAIYDDRPLLGSFGGAAYIPSSSAYEHSDEELKEHLSRMSQIAGEHLHSAKAVMGYHVRSVEDVNLGVLTDLILNTDEWKIAYFILDTRHGIPSKKYLVAASEVTGLDWSSSALTSTLKEKDLVEERRYRVYDPVNQDENHRDFDYTGRPCLKALMEEIY